MYNNENITKKKSNAPVILPIVAVLFILFVCAIVFGIRKYNSHVKNSATTVALEQKWQEYDYSSVYEISRKILEKNPFNTIALTYHGYSSFYLAISQIDSTYTQEYLDTAVNSIRLALYNAKKTLMPQLEYMLGKIYYYKNTVTSYYYADLALQYFIRAKEHGYKCDDMALYIGLCYATLGEFENSIRAFSEALLVRESDMISYSIAEQYFKTGQLVASKQYLTRIISESQDDDYILKSMNLLGLIYIEQKNYSEARKVFDDILKKNQGTADAYYSLGVIYEKLGDIVKARTEWRKALKVQVNHAGALRKIAETK